jgi:hypothetical protein
MHDDEHIFLLLSHDLQNLAFIFSHQAHEAVSGGRKPFTHSSLSHTSFKLEKQQQPKKKSASIFVYIYILESLSSTPNFSRNQQKAALN